MSSNPAGLELARERIAREQEEQTGFMDLGNLGLTELPAELFELVHLEALNLDSFYTVADGSQARSTGLFGRNRLGEIDPRLARLTRLRRLAMYAFTVADVSLLASLEALELLELELGQAQDLSPLADLVRLRTLICAGGSSLADLTVLAPLTQLTSLDCSRTLVANLEPLRGLQALTSLDCWGTRVADLEPLRGLQALTSLDCWGTQVADLEPLRRLQALTSLDCGGTKVADLGPLRALQALASLHCSHTQVVDLEPLRALHTLTSLHCAGTQVEDLEPLQELQALTSLDCSHTQVVDLEPLRALTSLDCSHTQVVDLEPLRALQTLTSLDCSNSQVADLAPLQELHLLTSLDCSHTQVVDLEPLRGLQALTSLDCSGTQVEDLEPLRGLQALTSLNCTGTQVEDIEPLRALQTLTSLDCSSTQVEDIEPLQGLQALTSLHCSSTQVEDIEPLRALQALTSLDCSHTQVEDIEPLRALQALTSLNCWGTQVEDLAPLQGLHSLTSLDCSHTQVEDLAPLQELHSLTWLDCSTTPVTSLAPLHGLHSLTSLICRGTRVSDLSPLGRLHALTSLNCANTHVVDLEPLQGLHALTSLICAATQVVDLTPLHGLHALKSLNCAATQVADLAPLEGLHTLGTLTCSHTLVTDLAPLQGLQALRVLDCSHSQVTDLSPLNGLLPLQVLTIHGCDLEGLPAQLLSRESFQTLRAVGARITPLPPEVLSTNPIDNCLERVRDHVRDLQAGAQPVRDCKLIVLGNGLVGKTQICRRLRGDDFDEDIPSTHGITVDTAPLGDGPTDPVLNLWDFGGQDIYHGTHALFTRSRALFLIVWNPASEATEEYDHEGLRFRNHPLPYWLEYVRNLGGRDSAVILLQSQCDGGKGVVALPPVLDGQLDFPFARIQHYSAKDDHGRGGLFEAIRDGIQHLRDRHGLASIGKGRAEVVRRIRSWQEEDRKRPPGERLRRTISLRQFDALCAEVGGIHSPASLLRYLHDTGVVFHSQEHFGTRVILDQSWALEAVYAVFDRRAAYRHLKNLGGRFKRSLLEVLAWSSYTPAEQTLFIELMTACNVCFQVRPADEERDIEAEYCAPDLLPERNVVQSALTQRGWRDDAPGVVVRFEFDFLHLGVIRSLVASVGRQAVDAGVYWRNGVWVREARTGATATLEAEHHDRIRGRIVLRVQGTRREELARRLVTWIQRRGDWSPTETEVEVDGTVLDAGRAEALLSQYDTPTGRKGASRTAAAVPEESEPREAPLEFTGAAPRRRTSPEVFVSYARKDADPEGSERAPVDRLCDALVEHGVTVIRDTTHLRAGMSISEFVRDLAAGDLIVLVIGEHYLKSTWCMTELHQIYLNCGQDPTRFRQRIIPILLTDARVDDTADRIDHILHWADEFEKLEPKIKSVPHRYLGASILEEYRRIHEFATHVGDILGHVVDQLVPRDFEALASADFAPILDLIARSKSSY